MKLGTAVPDYCTDRSGVPPETIRDWAVRAEDAGFAGLWVMDHLVEPEPYQTNVLDPLLTLSHVAAVTDRIPLGTAILLLPLRRTANVASQVATLQQLSHRPLTLGLGAGYVPEEFEVTGVPKTSRGPRLSEGIDVLQRLFEGNTSYSGRFHDFKDVRIDPVPEQPPELLAGGGAKTLPDGTHSLPKAIGDRILATDGWIAPPVSIAKLRTDWELIAAHAEDNDRDSDALRRVALNYVHVVDGSASTVEAAQRAVFENFFAPHLGFDHAREHCLVGTVEDIVNRVREYETLGFDQLILAPAARDPVALKTQLGRWTSELLPAVA